MIRTRRLFALVVLVTSAAGAAGQGFDPLMPGAVSTPAGRPATATPRATRLPRPEAQAPRPEAAAKPPSPVIVDTTVDRTAVWVGDPLTYTIEITCPPGTDILAADIARDRLRLTGLQVVDAIQQRETRPDGGIAYRARFRLVSYVSDGSRVGIDPQSVRYYVHTAGQPPETLVPADEVQLPSVAIGVRSALADDNISWIRDRRTITRLPSAAGFLTLVGVVAVAVALVPVVAGFTTVMRNRKPRRTVRSRRETLQQQRQALDEIKARGGASDAAVRRDVFEKLNALIRDRLSELDVPARTSTADEIERTIADRGGRLPAAGIAAVLRDCERAVYGRPDELPGADAVSAALEEAERLMAARVR